MKLVVVHNPTAGYGVWTADRVERTLRAAGHQVQVVSTKDKWRDLLEQDADAFVAAGGDGTVHKLIHALESRDTPVAILPTGTANNIAHAFGYTSGDDLVDRAARWKENERVLQIARAHADGNSRPFLEVIGAGVFARMMRSKRIPAKRAAPPVALLGIRKRLAEDLLRAKPIRVTTDVDGNIVEAEYVMLECLNLPFYGPRLRLAPDQSPASSSLTVAGVRAGEREPFAEWVASGAGEAAAFAIDSGKHIVLVADALTHLDGERWPAKHAGDRRLVIDGGVRAARVWV